MSVNSQSGRVDWTPKAHESGDHTFTVRADDGLDQVERSYTLTIFRREDNLARERNILDAGGLRDAPDGLVDDQVTPLGAWSIVGTNVQLWRLAPRLCRSSRDSLSIHRGAHWPAARSPSGFERSNGGFP